MTTTETAQLKLEAALWEARRHARALAGAQNDLPPLTAITLDAIAEDVALERLLDQLLFRFLKLQDAMGQRLVPATLAVLAESFEEWPMQDRLSRLEKLGYLTLNDWFEWRDLRNRLAHEYPDDHSRREANLLAIVKAVPALLAAHEQWVQRLPALSLRSE